MLSAQQKQTREDASLALLHLYNENPEDFISRVITNDEIWIHHYDPESKQESMQWVEKGSKPPTKARVRASAGKVMLTVCWILLEFYWSTSYHTNKQLMPNTILKSFAACVKQSLRNTGVNWRVVPTFFTTTRHLKRRVLIRMPSDTLGFANHRLRFNHLPYSPDLAPSDFHLFPNLKKSLRWRHFENDEEHISAVNVWFKNQPTRSTVQTLRKHLLVGTNVSPMGANMLKNFNKLYLISHTFIVRLKTF